MLAVPTLITDPELIELDEAARTFGTWQAKFVDHAGSLPAGAMSVVGDSLVDFGNTLEPTQRAYLDALRADDQATAAVVVAGLEDSLDNFERLLATTLNDVAAKARDDLESSDLALSQLLS